MTQLPDSTSAENQVVSLQAVSFESISSNPKLAVYQAEIVDQANFPGITYSLTVTTASPGDDPASKKALQDFLDEIRAGLEVLPGPPQVSLDDEAPEPFNPDQQVMFAFELIESTGPEPVDVGLVVETTTGLDIQAETPDAPGVNAAGREVEARFTVGPGGREHYWTSRTPAWARVDVVTGRGNIRNPRLNVAAPGKYPRYTRQVIVQGAGRMKYDWHGNSFKRSVH
jgi:hypothetical protein